MTFTGVHGGARDGETHWRQASLQPPDWRQASLLPPATSEGSPNPAKRDDFFERARKRCFAQMLDGSNWRCDLEACQ